MAKEGKDISVGIPWLCLYEKAGDLSLLVVFGFNVYARSGNACMLFWFIYNKEG